MASDRVDVARLATRSHDVHASVPAAEPVLDSSRPEPNVAVDEAPRQEELRARYRGRLRVAARDSGVIVGIIALVAFPAWSWFDVLLVPHQARMFIAVRVMFELPIALAFAALWWRRTGERWPEALAFAVLALPEIAIAWMIPRSEPHLEAYLLGFSLAIYASAFLLHWRWQLTAYLFVLTMAATAFFLATSHPHLDATHLATIGFYLTTAGSIAIAGQLYRNRSGWEQFVTQALLERERTRNEALVAQLDRLSREDDLTKLSNRRAWDAWLLDQFRRARRANSPMAVMVCDLDHLKAVNDRFGHIVGDEALRVGAVLLAGRMRSTDFVGRLGGDEFAIGCPDTSLTEAVALANDLVLRAQTTAWPGHVPITLSIGVAELQPDDTSPLNVVDRADTALYRAKLSRNAVCASE